MINSLKNKTQTMLLGAALVLSLGLNTAAEAAQSVDTDPRIKTLVYDENDVFTVTARPGFQTNIEFAPNEVIDTMSIGDSVGWQLTPATHRIFVKPLQNSGVTNLSVITNKHSYQFELVATSGKASTAYVIRFFYPDETTKAPDPIDRTRASLRPVSATAIPELPVYTTGNIDPSMPQSIHLPGSDSGSAVAPAPIDASSAQNGPNFNYTLTGPETLAPSKIYDDGKSTTFEFKTHHPSAQVAMVRPDGSEIPVLPRQDGTNIIVDQTASKFTIRENGMLVCVFNESMKLPQLPSTRPY